MKNTKQNVFSNLAWRFAERSGAYLVGFIVSIVLARILGPEAYGTIALITVFTTILQVFVDSGLGNALIQKKDAEDIDYMCEQFYQHKNLRCQESRLSGNVKVIHRTFFFRKIKLLFCKFREEKVKKAIYCFSVPLFNKKRDRALLYFSDPIGGNNLILIKNDSGWNVDGSILLDMWIT